jgi:hypothetical protein
MPQNTKQMTKAQKQTMYQQIEQHGNNLNAIFNTGIDPVKLCKSLRRLELKANKIATDWCNGVIDTENIDHIIEPVMKATRKILGTKYPIQFNGDARGYALKISDKIMKSENLSLYQDWGGYGIICPDFTPSK